ncbi:Lsr2 family protein [Streptomyces sp. NPDC005244]|uniref:histone-like nucleoid-structuring protein Lsr2 n=1 Tax=Streptomyces sp. NPDC005244 TaxID=3364708 RepID=UPI0036A25B9A
MAQKIQTIYIDDFTGNESDEVNTHVFSLDGVSYEIDLIPENYDKLFEALEPFIDKGRKQGRVKGAPKARKSEADGPSAEEVRAWARVQGIEVNDRGRVPANVREQYEAAH